MNTCKHPSSRQFWWHAYDGTLCGGCCECGEVMQGGTTLEDEEIEAQIEQLQ